MSTITEDGTTDGANLTSKDATGGTVHLLVNHDEEHYEIRADADHLEADWLEIGTYLSDHGFEIMPEHECEAELRVDGGYTYWAAHFSGVQFNSLALEAL